MEVVTNLTTSLLNSTLSSDNSTIFPCPGEGGDPRDTSDEFSVQNVVGMFLTLALCLLTQPYGSLFYDPPPTGASAVQHALFFPWRLNPLACIAETVVIAVGLFHAMRLAFQDPETLLLSISRKFPYYHPNTEKSRNWKKHWHLHTAALLIIRANPEGDDGGGVLERFMAESLLENADSSSGDAVELRSPRTGASEVDSSGQGHGEPDTVRDVELGLEEAQSGQDRLADLRKILGNSVLAHKEKWVGLVTTFSALVVTIKLAATTLPWTVRVPAAFFLAGWSSVQLLLYLFHLGELDETSAAQIVKTIRLQRHYTAMPNTQRLTAGLVVFSVAGPVLWLGYCAGFSNGEISPDYMMVPWQDHSVGLNNATSDSTPAGVIMYHVAALLPWFVAFFMVGSAFLLLVPLIASCMIFLCLDECCLWLPGSRTYRRGPLRWSMKYREHKARQEMRKLRTVRNILTWLLLCLGRILLVCFCSSIAVAPMIALAVGAKTGGPSGTAWRVFNGLVGITAMACTPYLVVSLLFSISRIPEFQAGELSRNRGLLLFYTAELIPLWLFGIFLYSYDSAGTYQRAWVELLG